LQPHFVKDLFLLVLRKNCVRRPPPPQSFLWCDSRPSPYPRQSTAVFLPDAGVFPAPHSISRSCLFFSSPKLRVSAGGSLPITSGWGHFGSRLHLLWATNRLPRIQPQFPKVPHAPPFLFFSKTSLGVVSSSSPFSEKIFSWPFPAPHESLVDGPVLRIPVLFPQE